MVTWNLAGGLQPDRRSSRIARRPAARICKRWSHTCAMISSLRGNGIPVACVHCRQYHKTFSCALSRNGWTWTRSAPHPKVHVAQARYIELARRPDGETGIHKGLKIPRRVNPPCRFEPGSGHHSEKVTLPLQPSRVQRSHQLHRGAASHGSFARGDGWVSISADA